MKNERVLKQFRIKPINDGVRGSYALIGFAYGLKAHPDATKVSTGAVAFRNEDGTQVVLRSGKGWRLDGIDANLDTAGKAQVEEYLRKTPIRKFSIDADGNATILTDKDAPAEKSASAKAAGAGGSSPGKETTKTP